MSPEPDVEAPPSPRTTTAPRSKGKDPAPPPDSPTSERTPLLSRSRTASRASTRSRRSTSTSSSVLASPHRRGWCALCAKLTLVFTASTLLVLAGLFALGKSYAARAERIDPATALVVRPPLHIRVLDHSEGHLTLATRVRAGVDAALALGLVPDERGPEHPDSFLLYAWKALGRAGIRRMGSVSVSAGRTRIRDPVTGVVLATARMETVQVPLGAEVGDEWMREVEAVTSVDVSDDADAMVAFAKRSWMSGRIELEVEVEDVKVRGGGGKGWRGLLKVDQPKVEMGIRKEIPAIPGMPAPGRDAPLPDMSRLVTLTSFDIRSTSNDSVVLNATSTLVNPAPPEIDLTIPALPYLVSLPGPDNTTVPMARAHTDPFSLSERPNITMHITGTVLPLQSSAAFSSFLSSYLGGRAHPILLQTPLYPKLTFESEFPAPDPPPRVMREMEMRDMRVRLVGGVAVGSGTVYARIVLPKGINIGMEVKRVIPDVLIFDGPVPTYATAHRLPQHTDSKRERGTHEDDEYDEEPPLPPSPPLPDPLPPRAFAHIRPDHWLPAWSVPDEGDRGDDDDNEHGTAITITSPFEDVPLVVLPGRQREFGEFVRKIVFGRGAALAGLQGHVSVHSTIPGLPSGNGSVQGVVLDRLPFEGNVYIGKPKF